MIHKKSQKFNSSFYDTLVTTLVPAAYAKQNLLRRVHSKFSSKYKVEKQMLPKPLSSLYHMKYSCRTVRKGLAIGPR